jgi:predicted lipid-binding transport protein (Tim44 family)
MSRIFLSSLLALALIGGIVTDAAAGRFGGSRSFHSVRSSSLFSNSYGKYSANKPSMSQRATHSKWRGALTGLLMGGLLASLFMGHGFGGLLMSWIVLGLAVFLIMRLLSQRKHRHSEQRVD